MPVKMIIRMTMMMMMVMMMVMVMMIVVVVMVIIRRSMVLTYIGPAHSCTASQDGH